MGKRSEEAKPEEIKPVKPHRMEAPYSYYTHDGVHKNWAPNQVITDPEEIHHLKERGARIHEIPS